MGSPFFEAAEDVSGDITGQVNKNLVQSERILAIPVIIIISQDEPVIFSNQLSKKCRANLKVKETAHGLKMSSLQTGRVIALPN